MKKDSNYFAKEFEKQRIKFNHIKPSNIVYGSNVMQILRIYKDLENFEEKEAFRNALENMLANPNDQIRQYGIDVCLGFFIFRDEI